MQITPERMYRTGDRTIYVCPRLSGVIFPAFPWALSILAPSGPERWNHFNDEGRSPYFLDGGRLVLVSEVIQLPNGEWQDILELPALTK